MATSNREQMERGNLSCSICASVLKEPKTLKCMHRFCESCLNGHIVASTARASVSRRGFSCPNCREFIQAPDSTSSPSTWASLFKTDFIVKSMVEVYQLQQEVNPPEVSNHCPKHEDKEQELYCYDCSATVCHLCAVISHRGCGKISTVKEAAQRRRATWQDHLQQISGLLYEAQQIEKLRENNLMEVRSNKTCVEVEIRQTAEKMRKMVSDEEQKLLNEVHKNFSALHQHDLKFTEYINNLQNLEANAVSMLASSSDFNLMLETGVSNALDSGRINSVVINEDYQRFCEKLPAVKCRFELHKLPCLSPGNVTFECHVPGDEVSDFPMPSSWQRRVANLHPTPSSSLTNVRGFILKP